MAKYRNRITGDFNHIRDHIKKEIISTSASSSLEEEETIYKGDIIISVLTFERYSYSGGNRLSLNVVLVGDGNTVDIVGTSTGGSNGLFMKFNTWGEDAFLEKLKQAIDKL